MSLRNIDISPVREAALLAHLRLKYRATIAVTDDSTLAGKPEWVDPVAWTTNRLGEHLWSRQADIARAVVEHRRVAVRASYDVGKSFVASRLAAWWIETHAPGEAFVVSTAPGFAQVRGILWREINRAHAKGHLIGRVNQTEWWIGNEMVAFGRKPSDYDPTAMQGLHARYVLVIADEATGIPYTLWQALEGLIANEDSRFLAIGNPTDPGSTFATFCKPGSGWHEIGISAFDSPNFTGEEVDPNVAAQLVSHVWVDERRAEWGEDSPLWKARVLGEFPEDVSDAVVPLSWVAKCRLPDQPPSEKPGRTEIGVDVGAGGDQSVAIVKKGRKASLGFRASTPDPMTLVGMIVNLIKETGARRCKVDVIGIGWGVVGRLRELSEQGVIDCEIFGVNVADKARDPEKFGNLRDEIWWDVGRESSRLQSWDLSDLPESTIAQLIAPKYKPDSAGRVKVEKKEDTKKRLGRSPDEADALLLAYHEPLDLVDPAMVYGIYTCIVDGWMFVFSPGRPCPRCGTPAPQEYPTRD